MSADRKSLLDIRQKAKSALANPALPQSARIKYQDALRRAEIALAMDDAATRKAEDSTDVERA